MHSSRTRTTHSLPYRGGLPEQRPQTETPLDRDPPGQRPPWTESSSRQRHLLDRDPHWTETPWTETSLDKDPLTEVPWTETPSCDLRCMLGQKPPLTE